MSIRNECSGCGNYDELKQVDGVYKCPECLNQEHPNEYEKPSDKGTI